MFARQINLSELLLPTSASTCSSNTITSTCTRTSTGTCTSSTSSCRPLGEPLLPLLLGPNFSFILLSHLFPALSIFTQSPIIPLSLVSWHSYILPYWTPSASGRILGSKQSFLRANQWILRNGKGAFSTLCDAVFSLKNQTSLPRWSSKISDWCCKNVRKLWFQSKDFWPISQTRGRFSFSHGDWSFAGIPQSETARKGHESGCCRKLEMVPLWTINQVGGSSCRDGGR